MAEIVDGVTKLKHLPSGNLEEAQAESLRKMIVAMSRDVRVIIIKLADRLHNMRTLSYLKRETQLTQGPRDTGNLCSSGPPSRYSLGEVGARRSLVLHATSPALRGDKAARCGPPGGPGGVYQRGGGGACSGICGRPA